ncbi:late secretory pathway protein avl9 [Podila epigama]|nr:late secretory pathway protein avl9 [Podila epigama]
MGLILHIIVVGLTNNITNSGYSSSHHGSHHAHGPIVEYAFPPFPGQPERTSLGRLEVPEEWSLLPFLALPDGSHQSDEDFTYFHLPPVKARKDVDKTLFGISCNRQILTKDLLVKTDDVTRSSVQKAVVPIFGVLRQRLAVVTAAWFGQKDFTQTDILSQFYDSLNATISDNIPDSAFLMGTSLRELVKKFKYKLLVLVKLLLLEKRVIFFGYPVETLCTYQYSLVSLVPGLLKSLQDAGSPLLDSQELYMQSMSKTPAHSTEKQELFKYLGLPLHIFGEQIDILQDPLTRSYIIGTTNAIFLHNRDCGTDVIVNTEPGTIDFLQDSLSTVLSLTSADRRWMDEIIEAVNNSNNDDVDLAQAEYAGSDDYLRAKFEEYILTLLSSVKHSQYAQIDDSIEAIGNNTSERNMTSDYGTHFIKAWQQTPNYQLWNDFVDWELLNEIVAPGHPCQGNFSLAHVQRRLANQFKDMRIDKNFVPLKQSFSRAMTTSRERLSNVFDTVWQEFEKLQPEDQPSQGSLEPSLYSSRTQMADNNNKGLIQSASTNPVQKPMTRSIPDPELYSEDESNDAVIPQSANGRSPSVRSAPSVSRGESLVPSPVSFTSSLGPATAATAALGQKAVGMFSNVSSFFQAKKKELMDAQREAEEQYQQRIHQHERKKKAMQERAKATASTFAFSSPNSALSRTSSTGSSRGGTPATEAGIYAYVAPRTTKNRLSTSKPVSLAEEEASGVNKTDTDSTKDATVAEVAEDVTAESSKAPQIASPTPVVLTQQSSPMLTRGAGGGIGNDDRFAEGEDNCGGLVDSQEQLAIEQELQEALETIEISGRSNDRDLLPLGDVSSEAAATRVSRSLTPAETSSPFSEISAPSSPVKGEFGSTASSSVPTQPESETDRMASAMPVQPDVARDTDSQQQQQQQQQQQVWEV